jgi:hypothetical protein
MLPIQHLQCHFCVKTLGWLCIIDDIHYLSDEIRHLLAQLLRGYQNVTLDDVIEGSEVRAYSAALDSFSNLLDRTSTIISAT